MMSRRWLLFVLGVLTVIGLIALIVVASVAIADPGGDMVCVEAHDEVIDVETEGYQDRVQRVCDAYVTTTEVR